MLSGGAQATPAPSTPNRSLIMRGGVGFAESVAKDLKTTTIRVTSVTLDMILTPMARESDAWPLGLDWLDPRRV